MISWNGEISSQTPPSKYKTSATKPVFRGVYPLLVAATAKPIKPRSESFRYRV